MKALAFVRRKPVAASTSPDTLRASRPTLLIEIEERHNPGALQRVTALLGGLGYGGWFLDEGRMRPIGEFDLKRDQNSEHVGLRGRLGRYLNNFLFKA